MVNRTLRTDVLNPATGDRFNFPNTVVIITDGQSNVDVGQTLPEARELQGFADVFVVGITDNIDYQELSVGLADVILVGHS